MLRGHFVPDPACRRDVSNIETLLAEVSELAAQYAKSVRSRGCIQHARPTRAATFALVIGDDFQMCLVQEWFDCMQSQNLEITALGIDVIQ